MRSSVHVSWTSFGVALCVLLFALALLVVAGYQDSWGSAAQYSLGTLAVLAIASIGYVVGRRWVLLLPWAVVAALIAAATLDAMRSSDWEGVLGAIVWGGMYALVVDIPLAVGLAATAIRGRHRRDHLPYPSESSANMRSWRQTRSNRLSRC